MLCSLSSHLVSCMVSPVFPKTLTKSKPEAWNMKSCCCYVLCLFLLEERSPPSDALMSLCWFNSLHEAFEVAVHASPSWKKWIHQNIKQAVSNCDAKRRELIFNWCKGALNSCEYTQVSLYLLVCCIAMGRDFGISLNMETQIGGVQSNSIWLISP